MEADGGRVGAPPSVSASRPRSSIRSIAVSISALLESLEPALGGILDRGVG
jgi:hypothetical protein